MNTPHEFSELTVLKTYPSEAMAEMARAKLADHGIKAMVSKDDCGGMRPHLQLTMGVRLLVRSVDRYRAEQIMETSEEKDWTCPGCGEHLEGQFQVCWKCGTARPLARHR